MQLIVMHERLAEHGSRHRFLPMILATDILAPLVYEAHGRLYGSLVSKKMIAVPSDWQVRKPRGGLAVARYRSGRLRRLPLERLHHGNRWCIISNGRFVTDFAGEQIERILANRDGAVAIQVIPSLRAYRENICLGSGGCLAGFKRIYAHSVSPGFLGSAWPHHVCVRFSALDRLLIDGELPLNFDDFLNICSMRSLGLTCLNVGGSVLDLESETGLLNLFRERHIVTARLRRNARKYGARVRGNVLMGDNVHIGDDALVVGPAVLADRCSVGRGALVKGSVIAPDVHVPDDAVVSNRVLISADVDIMEEVTKRRPDPLSGRSFCTTALKSGYRMWPMFSYARFTKRVLDIVFASAVLCLFAPVFPLIAFVLKVNSPGPVFFKHRRQGLHGRPFDCLKFRTMIVQAHGMQDKLRSKNHVDGPQFMIEDDPRVTGVGKFLRATFIDEIPQFVNVLLGQMSVVGPRPSPETENMLCPFWRDARLSVRPGVTGLWQVQRTRRFGQDFQEWIHYDTEYVRNMSFRQDVAICCKTVRKLISNFVHHVRR